MSREHREGGNKSMAVAQLVERLTQSPELRNSNPTIGTTSIILLLLSKEKI